MLPPVTVYALDSLSVDAMISSASSTSSTDFTAVYGRPAFFCCR